MKDDEICAYVHAWARHEIFMGFASADATVRSGLSAMEAARLSGATLLEACSGGVRSLPAVDVPVDVMVEDDALTYRFPHGHPDPARRGALNGEFLEPHRFVERLLPILDALCVRIVVLCPAPFYRTDAMSLHTLMRQLDRFLAVLPRPYCYALEPPADTLLQPEYFACLRSRGVMHVFTEGDALLRRLPPVSEQLQMAGAFGGPYCVVRATSWTGAPGIQWPRPDVLRRRQGWADAVRRCLAAGLPLHLFIDDEADPLHSLGVLMAMLNDDLARLSRFGRRAA